MNNSIRTYLIELARQKANQTVTYQKLSDDCNLGFNMRENPHERKEIGSLLGDISRFEFEQKRPLLSALVIRFGDNSEGDGFYQLAEELGLGNWKKLKKEGLFEAIEIGKCIAFWSDNTNYLKYR
jgi:hypothetical protein